MTPKLHLITLCLLVTANGSPAWETYHGDGGLTGRVDTEFPTQVTIHWRSAVPGKISLPCLVDREFVYALTDSGELVALDRHTGERKWLVSARQLASVSGESKPPPAWSGSGVLVGQGIALGTTAGSIYLVSRKDGRKLWERDLGERIYTNLGKAQVETGDLVLAVTQGNGVMYALDAADGREVWRSAEIGRSDCPPSAGSDFAVYGSCASAMHIISLQNGKEAHSAALGDDCQVASGTAIVGTMAYAGNRAGSITAVSLPDGEIKWRENVSEGGVFCTPAVTEKQLVSGDDNGFIFCLDAKTGKQLWKRKLSLEPTSPVVTRNQVLTTDDGVVYGLALASGEIVWQKTISDHISAAAVFGRTLYLGTDEREVIAIGGDPGESGEKNQTEENE